MLALPPVELPDEGVDECRALMVIVPVLTDPPQWKRRQRRPVLLPIVLKASLVPALLAVLTLSSLWLATDGQSWMPEPVRDSLEQWVAIADIGSASQPIYQSTEGSPVQRY